MYIGSLLLKIIHEKNNDELLYLVKQVLMEVKWFQELL